MTAKDRIIARWTNAECDRVRQMWADGATAGTIGKALGRTRNSVIGCVHRLRLPSRESPIITKLKKKAAQFSATAAKPRDGCQWPLGDPRQPGLKLCGAECFATDTPYCTAHEAAARAPIQPARLR